MAVVATMFAATSCSNADSTLTPSLSIEPRSLTFAATGNESQQVTVTAENIASWDFTVSSAAQEWLTAVKSGDNILSISVADNETAEQRSGTVRVSAADHPEIGAISLNVTQSAGELQEINFSVSPTALTFASDATEAQVVTVTTDEGVTFTATPADGADWVHLAIEGNEISVTVDAWEDTSSTRSANITVTPDVDASAARVVRVTQEAAPVLPSMTVTTLENTAPTPLEVAYNDRTSYSYYITVTGGAYWTQEVLDAAGELATWVKVSERRNGEGADGIRETVTLTFDVNNVAEPRSATLYIYSNHQDVPNVEIPITQAAGRTTFSTLEGNVTITEGISYSSYAAYPGTATSTATATQWDIKLYTNTLQMGYDSWGYEVATGSGAYLNLKLYSTPFQWVEDMKTAQLPTGRYEIYQYADNYPSGTERVPLTIMRGWETYGAWYTEYENGEENGIAGPLMEGYLDVTNNGDGSYTMLFEFTDDLGYTVSGGPFTFNFSYERVYQPSGDTGWGDQGDFDEDFGQE